MKHAKYNLKLRIWSKNQLKYCYDLKDVKLSCSKRNKEGKK